MKHTILLVAILITIALWAYLLGSISQPTVDAQPPTQSGVVNAVPITPDVELIQINIPQPGFARDARCFIVHNKTPSVARGPEYSAASCVN